MTVGTAFRPVIRSFQSATAASTAAIQSRPTRSRPACSAPARPSVCKSMTARDQRKLRDQPNVPAIGFLKSAVLNAMSASGRCHWLGRIGTRPFSRYPVLTALMLIAAGSAFGQETNPTPTEQLKQLVTEYDAIHDRFMKDLRTDRTTEGVHAANVRNQEEMKAWWKNALDLIQQHPAESAAVPVIENYLIQNGVDNVELVDVLRKYHMADPRLVRMVQSLYQSLEAPSWKFALEIAHKHPDRTARTGLLRRRLDCEMAADSGRQ